MHRPAIVAGLRLRRLPCIRQAGSHSRDQLVTQRAQSIDLKGCNLSVLEQQIQSLGGLAGEAVLLRDRREMSSECIQDAGTQSEVAAEIALDEIEVDLLLSQKNAGEMKLVSRLKHGKIGIAFPRCVG